MSNILRAQSLEAVLDVLSPEPLPSASEWYVNLSPARSGEQLAELRKHLEVSRRRGATTVHLALVGPRGGGKTTELHRLEGDLETLFTPVHLELDPALENDADYTDLLLWLVERVASQLSAREVPLDRARTEPVLEWFDKRTVVWGSSYRSEFKTEAETAAGLDANWLMLRLKSLLRIQAAISGSTDRRKEFRRELQERSSDLVAHVNLFLDHVREQLRRKGMPDCLLIVQDNLDRLLPEPAKRLFFEHGQVLRGLKGFFIWTAPLGIQLAPYRLDSSTYKTFYMPIPAPRRKNGDFNEAALTGLQHIIDQRMDIGAVFDSPATARQLCLASGGSLRDLLKLVGDAQLSALVDNKSKMDGPAADKAAKKLRLEFERALTPGNHYFPLLAQIHLSKREPEGEDIKALKDRFAEMIACGSVLQYNGEDTWFDVHPAILSIASFQDALHALRASRARIQPA